jgi:SAM-dependent methyltransferase
MNFFRRSELTPPTLEFLADYDRQVLRLLGPDYPHPVRMRDWELARVLQAIADGNPGARVLDTGSFNTYLGLYLSRTQREVTVSDLLWARALKSGRRRLGLAPAKKSEVGYLKWHRAMRRHGLKVRNIDLTRISAPDASFDCVIALSVIEHIPAVERAVAEMYRVLAPGGRLLITTDCAPEPMPFAGGTRYFSAFELTQLFADYPVTSATNQPDFSVENWCYDRTRPIVTSFVEITKPR